MAESLKTLEWPFLRDENGKLDHNALQRYQMQAVSDIYKTMQARLDGYRQSAAAVFLGFFAALLTLDSALARIVIDPQFLNSISAIGILRLAWVAGTAIVIVVVLGSIGAIIIDRIGRYFAEMTSIIYKIDMMNQVFVDDVWLKGMSLYPRKFQPDKKVGRSREDTGLPGWTDPSIGWFRNLTIGAVLLHVMIFGISACLWLRTS